MTAWQIQPKDDDDSGNRWDWFDWVAIIVAAAVILVTICANAGCTIIINTPGGNIYRDGPPENDAVVITIPEEQEE